MRFLLFMDYWRYYAICAGIGVLLSLAIYLVKGPRRVNGWKKTAVRITGSVLFIFVVPIGLMFLFFQLHDLPRTHCVTWSPAGSRVALLSHSEIRDSSATDVTVSSVIAAGDSSRTSTYEMEKMMWGSAGWAITV